MAVFNYLTAYISHCIKGSRRCRNIGLTNIQVIDFPPFLLASSANGTSFRIGEAGICWPLLDIPGMDYFLVDDEVKDGSPSTSPFIISLTGELTALQNTVILF